jgi:DNA (cytosine-5)-methyltransferase 1
MAAEAFFGATTLWVSDVDPDASTVLARRFPGAPNLGDLKALRWDDVPPVDVLTAGYPCQPFSQAGLRRGHHDERHLWPHIRDGIEALRPKAVLLENVRGHLRLGAGQVISDLAHLGYVGRWEVVRASDAGACHRRERLFILGWQYRGPTPPHTGSLGAQLHRGRGVMVGPQGGPCHEGRGGDHEGGPSPGDRPPSHRPSAGGRGDRGRLEEGVVLLPTPLANETGRAPEAHMAMRRRMGRATPTSLPAALGLVEGWGPYRPAVERWAALFGPAPPPVYEPMTVEWMMGLPRGWVSDMVAPRRALKLLGNGVMPQQALHALHRLTADIL